MNAKHFYSTEQLKWKEETVCLSDVSKPNLWVADKSLQSLKGFGGCFNELGWKALQGISHEKRNQVLDALFSPDGDCRFKICRLPIGASDYAVSWYSYNEVPDDYAMKSFSIERDRQFLLPYIREALCRNPHLELFASPWSPPTWMKSTGVYNHGALIWQEQILKAYALYFVKFIAAYGDEGIPISQVHVQNEPISDHKFPCCQWSGEQLRDFIGGYLGPLFESHGITTDIWLGTLNGPDQTYGYKETDYDAYANTVLSDPVANRYVKGIGYQWGGKHALLKTKESWPEKHLMQTENECGNGENTWAYALYVFDLFRHYLTYGVEAYVYWNMVLEPGGKSSWGWRQNAMITIDSKSEEVLYNPEFYVMKHFSHFIQAGAQVRGLKGQWAANGVVAQNPDGSYILVICNPFPRVETLTLAFEKSVQGNIEIQMQPYSVNTLVIQD